MPERTIWVEGARVFIVDQTMLPLEHRILEIHTLGEMWEAIKSLRVRGAPAIGVAAAFGVWLGIKDFSDRDTIPVRKALENACNHMITARPTAVNLFWAVARIRALIDSQPALPNNAIARTVFSEANAMLLEDAAVCESIGRHGAALFPDRCRVLTHCNAGALATAGAGTALSPLYHAAAVEGKHIEVYADETRPLLQGARLTAYELQRAGIPVTLICDSMAATVMRQGRIDAVVVGTDRVAANGDVANKVGTYGVAVLAARHGIPFYVAAPLSSIDLQVPDGDSIPIEERAPEEVTMICGVSIAPPGVHVYNPAFDITPAELVTAFITERGIVRPPFPEGLAAVFAELKAEAASVQ